MDAKSNKPFPIVAFGGKEFVPYEWRPVPAGFEEAAKANPFLEVQESQPEPKPEPVEIDATDAAVELAAENGIDLATVKGSGADGRILKGDVAALLEDET